MRKTKPTAKKKGQKVPAINKKLLRKRKRRMRRFMAGYSPFDGLVTKRNWGRAPRGSGHRATF